MRDDALQRMRVTDAGFDDRLTRAKLRYILDAGEIMGPDYPTEAFRVLKNNDVRHCGERRRCRLTLDAWNRLVGNR